MSSKIEAVKHKIENRKIEIQQTYEEIKTTESQINSVRESIKQANNTVIELSIQDSMKQQRIQELLSQISKTKQGTVTPLKNKNKSSVRTSFKGCRNSQTKTISTMTPSTVAHNSNRKLIIKRLEMSKLKNSGTVDTEISTPDVNQLVHISPKYYSNN